LYSLRGFFQNGIVQGQVSHQLLQTSVLFLKGLELRGLFYPHTAIFFTPAVISLLGDAYLLAGFTYGGSLIQQNLSFT